MSTSMTPRLVGGAQRSVWLLRALLVAGVLVAMLAGVPEGHSPPVWFLVVVLVGALLSALRPEHLSLVITLLMVVVWWAFTVHDGMPAGLLVAATGVMVAHVAATLLAYGPPSLPVDPQLALLWSARGVLTWVGALVVWGVARTYAGHGTPAVFWLGGLTAAVVGSVVAGATLPVRAPETRE
jgi:hypothetical protein